jgi:hypothetical protein
MKLSCVLMLAGLATAQVPAYRTPRECARCHPAQAKPQPFTSMAHAMEMPQECSILKTHPLLTFQSGPYSYRIERKGDQSIYSVTDGHESLTAPIGWAFGLGEAGQTYVFVKDDVMYESRVSFYKAINALDTTIGATNAKPTDLRTAAGQPMDHGTRLACFGCHSTGTTPGVQCEHCHDPTENHLRNLTPMKSLKHMTAEDAANFCGQCHRTWDQVASYNLMGVINVRFQPYRLTNSKCFDADDARIACTGCHDPHQEVDHKTIEYDAKCQACHAGGKPGAKLCRVAKSDCASCHMPQVELPHAHRTFADHQIRIVRANDPYPN